MNKVWIKKNATGTAQYVAVDRSKFFYAVLSNDGVNDIIVIDGVQYLLNTASFENPKVLFKMTQSSTNAPSVTVLSSNVGIETIASSYDDVGTFHLTFPDGWLGDAPLVKVLNEGVNTTSKLVALPYDDTRLDIFSRILDVDFVGETTSMELANGVIFNAIIEVEILPE